MPYVAIVTILALLQLIWFAMRVASARGKYNVPAPATTGNEIFERHFRVHMNTLEQLVMFLPILWIYARFVSPIWAAGFGVLFIVGRFVYAAAYVENPRKRTLGFALTALPSGVMLIWILAWAVHAILIGAA